MARYYFHMQDHERVEDRQGMEHATPEEAKAHGTIVAEEIARNIPGAAAAIPRCHGCPGQENFSSFRSWRERLIQASFDITA